MEAKHPQFHYVLEAKVNVEDVVSQKRKSEKEEENMIELQATLDSKRPGPNFGRQKLLD